ncbi:metallophosphoesterase [Desulfobacter curvatus]|uniref:metallophosphoesterase n=1 Tax=Desulfobacter curvatus TaxID=2290 RepID=UPI00036D13B3|nr:metallophosphoesterase [Desulfobacter curvatus]
MYRTISRSFSARQNHLQYFRAMKLSVACLLLTALLLFPGSLLCAPALADEHKLSDEFLISPYVLSPDMISAVVAFHLKTPMPAKVTLFIDDSTRQFISDQARSAHFIKVDGLRPGEVFKYAVSAGNGQVKTPDNATGFTIKTAGRPGDSFHFCVFGDPRPGDTGSSRFHREVVSQVGELEPAFYLLLGDMVDQGRDLKLWQNFFSIEKELMAKSAIFPVLGDNDVDSNKGIGARFFPALKKGWYAFQWAGINFFALNAWDSRGNQDTAELDKNSEQMVWLKQELARPEVQSAPFRVVFIHDPVFISRGRSADLLKREWAPVFEQGNVDIVFSSWHLYERSHKNGVTYVISGGAGAELIWNPPDPAYASQAEARAHHFCRVDVNPRFMTLKAMSVDGTVLDELTLTPKTGAVRMEPESEQTAGQMKQEIFLSAGPDSPTLPLVLFSYDCPFCRRLLQRILPALSQYYQVNINISYFDLSQPEAYALFLTAGQAFGRQDADLPAIFAGARVIGGENGIREKLAREIEAFKKNPDKYKAEAIHPFDKKIDVKDAKTDAFLSLTPVLTAVAGLVDGLNPCAFATIILLVSYLTLFGLDQRTIIWAGATFTLGVFLAYLAIGLAFYHGLRQILLNSTLSMTVNTVMLTVVVVLAVVSLIDAVRVIRQKEDSAQILKMPKPFSWFIERLIRGVVNRPVLIFGTPFLLGLVISGLEFTCTGQVYVPIVTMLTDPAYRLKALGYLVVYNLAFIIPLVVVFFGAAFGLKVVKTGQNPMFIFASKLAHALLFVVMSLVLTYNLGWI